MPKQSILSDARIVFRHPGYENDDDDSIFLELPGFDHEIGGIHHGTALIICGIIACNTWDGYFTITINGEKIQEGHDEVLKGNEYYFHNPTAENGGIAYPLFACFNDWVFPHGKLPPAFSAITTSSTARTLRADTPAANLSQTIIDRDSTCRISDYGDALEAAHLCPTNVDTWWRGNRMSRYCKNKMLPSASVTADVNNVIALRKDIHHMMDDQKFALVPKDNTWKIHFFSPTRNLGGKYHNRPVQALSPEISPAFILTRLAWTIFPLARDFLEAGPRRKIKVRTKDGTRNDLWVFGEEIRLLHGQSTRRTNQSPTKRSLASVGENEGPKKRACYNRDGDGVVEKYIDADVVASRLYQWRNSTDLGSPSISPERQLIPPDSDSSRPISSHSSVSEVLHNGKDTFHAVNHDVEDSQVNQPSDSDSKMVRRHSMPSGSTCDSELDDILVFPPCGPTSEEGLTTFTGISPLKRKWSTLVEPVDFQKPQHSL